MPNEARRRGLFLWRRGTFLAMKCGCDALTGEGRTKFQFSKSVFHRKTDVQFYWGLPVFVRE
jgi:hypothetical protein